LSAKVGGVASDHVLRQLNLSSGNFSSRIQNVPHPQDGALQKFITQVICQAVKRFCCINLCEMPCEESEQTNQDG